jgi:hypothetical protein
MSYNFHVGQKVVYIYDGIKRPTMNEKIPVRNVVYTIRGFHPDGDAIHLEEIVNPDHLYCENGRTVVLELYFLLTSFRPLIKTDISIFQAMLVPTDKRIDA